MSLSQRRAQMLGRLRHRKTRAREGLVLVEGVRAVREALDAGVDVSFTVVSPRLGERDAGTDLLSRLEGRDVTTVDDAELRALADTEHPQGVLLVCAAPTAGPDLVGPNGRYVILDGIQDPGNAGTLIRAAAAFALDGVIALDGTVDPWSPKTVRASAGLVFRMPVWRTSAPAAMHRLATAGVPLFVTDAGGRNVDDVGPSRPFGLVLGNEGAGVRREVREVAVAALAVPMPGPAESLNVGMAGSILLYALTREASVG